VSATPALVQLHSFYTLPAIFPSSMAKRFSEGLLRLQQNMANIWDATRRENENGLAAKRLIQLPDLKQVECICCLIPFQASFIKTAIRQ
jgi:hypothetical protein